MKLSKNPKKRQKQLDKMKPRFTPHEFFAIVPRRCQDGVWRNGKIIRVAFRLHHDDPITYKYFPR